MENKLTLLRNKFFPQDINYLPAHITLFHSAPSELLEKLELHRSSVPVTFSEPVFFGKGFGVKVDCPELKNWRNNLLRLPLDFTPQDKNLKQLHVTIQNKVSTEQARKDFEQFKESWKKLDSRILGVQIWKYRGGPWELLENKKFSVSSISSPTS
jgi:hypothetical protein